MKIEAFYNVMKTHKDENDRVDLMKKHIIDRYITLEEKQALAKNIVQSSFYTRGEDGIDRFRVNSVAKYMLSCMTLLDTYTDIERGRRENKILEDFNKLNEIGFFDVLVREMSQRELKEFNMVLDMETNDLMTNEYEPGGFVRGQVERFGRLIGASLAPVLESLDLDKLEEIAKEYIGKLG